MSLSVLSLNIWNRSGPWPERAALIRAGIERLAPDLIGFQEVLLGTDTDQLRELTEGLGYYTDFERAIPFWQDPDVAFGNAVASRWPLLDREVLALPAAGTDEQRVALSVTVDAPVGPIGFTTTHLAFRLHHGYVREHQVSELCDLVIRRRPRRGFPPILCGDFNAEPESAEIRFVKGFQSLEGRSVHLRDAWAQRGEGPGVTWSNRNPYTGPWREPERRIDYVFVGPPHPDGRGVIERCEVVLADSENDVWPSDHFGVYTELSTTAG